MESSGAPPHLVRQIADLGAADVASAGGKAASLGELTRAGLRVPAGYVVTAEAFGLAMGTLDPDGSLRDEISGLPADDLGAIGRAAAGLRARITAAPLPPEVAAEITLAHDRLGAPAVAVRSSATLEDSPEASFAGLQDTYLAVRGIDAVLDRVRSCWASLYNDESVAYRRRLGLPERGLAMAVVIQRMLSTRAAGVMFTRSPVTGDRSVVAIEGTWGLGSALVAGEVTPDSFTVSKVTGEITGRQGGDQAPAAFLHAEPTGYLGRGHARRLAGQALPDRRRGPDAGPGGPPGRGALRLPAGHRVGAPG